MAIVGVEINDFLAFEGKFEADFCPGVNVLMGDNGTGKTTILKGMYANVKVKHDDYGATVVSLGKLTVKFPPLAEYLERISCKFSKEPQGIQCVYIPEKDILEHARGLLPFIEQKHTGFNELYKDVLVSAFDVQTKAQTEMQEYIGDKITNIIDGFIEWDLGTGSFYTVKTDGRRVPFAYEASAYKKLGYLGLLVACGRFEPGTILFWDEPENSLNPELVSVIVDILLKLAKNGVQVFIATHAYDVARYFDVREDKSIPVLFHNLTKVPDGGIACTSSPEYVKLPNNLLDEANEKLFKAVVADALGASGNE